jgi:NTE family protein
MFTLPIRRGRPTLPGGFIAGQRLSQFLTVLTWRAHPVHDFRDLPLTFAAVATDAETGEAVRLDAGYLPEAIQASIAIPSLFAPVMVDGRLLTDGGVARNLPAEDARALGADVVVCSDVSKPLMPADSLDDLLAVLDQTIGYHMWQSTLRQREMCDVLILPEIGGLSSAAFEKTDEWAERGAAAARAALPELAELGLTPSARPAPPDTVVIEPGAPGIHPMAPVGSPHDDSVYVTRLEVEGLRDASLTFVRDQLRIVVPGRVALSDLDAGIARVYDTGRFRIVQYRLDLDDPEHAGVGAPPAGAEPPGDDRLLRLTVVEQSLALLGLGYRYDSRYKASLLATVTLSDLLFYGTRLHADLRLGEQGLAVARFERRLGRVPEFIVGLGAGYRRVPFDIFAGDVRGVTPRAYLTHVELTAGVATGKPGVLGVRLKGEYADLDEFVAAGEPFSGDSRGLATVAAVLEYDSYDRAMFPRAGARIFAKSEHRIAGQGGSFAQHVADAGAALPILGGLSLLGQLTLGASADDIPDHYYFFLGGTNQYYLLPDRHIPFAGLRTMERHGRYLQAFQLGAQYEFHPRVVARLRWNAGAVLDEWQVKADLLTYGFDVTLAAVTRFGHAALSVAALDVGSLPRVVLDVGFPF